MSSSSAPASRKRLRLHPEAKTIAAQVGLSQAEWARNADVNVSTIKAALNPSQHPHRKGGISAPVAWKLARAYHAAATKLEPDLTLDDAYSRLIIEEFV